MVTPVQPALVVMSIFGENTAVAPLSTSLFPGRLPVIKHCPLPSASDTGSYGQLGSLTGTPRFQLPLEAPRFCGVQPATSKLKFTDVVSTRAWYTDVGAVAGE